MSGASLPTPRPPRPWALFLTVFLIATAGLVYELVAGAVASYVLGDSVTQFSLVIGLYLSALGIGAYLSKFVERDVAARFVDIELATALLGGVSAPLLLFAFARGASFQLVLWGVVLGTGTLVGLELPLLMRLLRGQVEFKDLIATALLFDYLGALAASVLFALVLVPTLGLVRTSLLFGLLNALVGLGSTWLLVDEQGKTMRAARVRSLLVVAFLLVLFSQAERLTRAAEVAFYPDPIWFAQQSSYQRIVVSRGRAGFSLHLNNNLQFSSTDEHRYHEALVHPAMALVPPAPGTGDGSAGGSSATSPGLRVLIAGGGDGLAAREALKYPEISRIILVDLDPAITRASATLSLLAEQNQGALSHPRVQVINDDAMSYLARSPERFDALFIDFPDPNNLALGKLFTTRFYAIARDHLSPEGAMVVQSTSPFYSRHSFWCIVRTMEAAGLHVRPYHAFVPAFGEWGFALARATPFEPPTRLRLEGLRFLDGQQLSSLFHFPPDLARVEGPINRLDNQALVRLYEREIGRFAAF
ncbi:MAG: polyamine aminopropyltransferase [Polyangiaceae bacterium]|nr:polyamine aminopropyltransferase [Polyangiaceae bacterium]